MGVEYLGEKVFHDEVAATGKIWVARGIHKNIYAQELDEEGFSLPVWSNRERALEYLKNARLVGPKYEPDTVSLAVFTEAWLSDKMMPITELQINPDGKTTRVLILTTEEFKAYHHSIH